mgnify:CR=1 FL=1|tara:strand:- start:369 stop:536 length:168 start_codon:yes stop_codon:yes gene_type:complete
MTYNINEDKIKEYYKYCIDNNIRFIKQGRPPSCIKDLRIDKCLKVKKGEYIITFQ